MAVNINQLVKCSWCKSQFVNPTFSNCTNCGGTLEYKINANELGPKPPMAPRQLPKKFIKRIKYSGNVMTIIGIVFTVPLFFTVIFPIIGIFLWKKGIKDANDELIPLENGTVTEGEITSIDRDYSKKINGKSPLTIKFIFNVGSQKLSGSVGNIFDDINLQKKQGDKLWVVYMPENPELSSVWPPLI